MLKIAKKLLQFADIVRAGAGPGDNIRYVKIFRGFCYYLMPIQVCISFFGCTCVFINARPRACVCVSVCVCVRVWACMCVCVFTCAQVVWTSSPVLALDANPSMARKGQKNAFIMPYRNSQIPSFSVLLFNNPKKVLKKRSAPIWTRPCAKFN